MLDKSSTKNVINAYRRRQQMGPFLIGGLAILLVIIGLVILITWLTGPNKPRLSLFATQTLTPTITFTPPPPSDTPTITSTPTSTTSPTPAAPFNYIVQQNDSLYSIAQHFNLGDNGIPLLIMLNPAVEQNDGIIYPGLEIMVPNPDMEMPTSTPIPSNVPRGTIVRYIVQFGDNLEIIASNLNSKVEEIVKKNGLTDANDIDVGQILDIPVNLVTPTATRPPTSTPVTTTATFVTPTSAVTATPTATSIQTP